MNFQNLEDNIDALVKTWMPGRAERMARKALDTADFDALAKAGLTLTGVPANHGGLWKGASQSARPVAMLLRELASVDPSLALVAAMHPTILMMWVVGPDDGQPAGWKSQQQEVLGAAREGHWFGTVASNRALAAIYSLPRRLLNETPI